MRKILSFIFILLLSSPYMNAQDLASLDTGKYRIDLPAYWKKGNKIWSILNDKLPLVSSELKDKELCGDDCNPKYILAFEMTGPVVSDHYLMRVIGIDSSESWKRINGNNFSFRASFVLLDNTGKLLKRFIVIEASEVWPLYQKKPPVPKAQTISQQIADPVGTTATAGIIGATSRDPLPIYNNRNYVIYKYDEDAGKNQQGPSESDLLGIVDKKIRGWE